MSASCNNKGIEKNYNKKEYIESIYNLPDDSRKKQLSEDAEYLTTLLDSIQDIRIYYSFSFGSGSMSEEDVDAAPDFVLPQPDTVIAEFSRLKTVVAGQEYSLPTSAFEVNIWDPLLNIDKKGFSYEIKKVFSNHKIVVPEDLGLQRADSLLVTASYTFATAFDTLIIDRDIQEDTLQYKEYVIDINEIDDHSIEIEYPVDLQVLSYQAISTGKILMDSKGYSSFPVFGLSPKIEDQIKEMISILYAAAHLNDKEACKAELEKIDNDYFTCIVSLIDFHKAYRELRNKDKDNTDDILKIIKTYLEKYSNILGPRYQCLKLSFPLPYTEILLYVASDTQTISRDVVAVCDTTDIRGEYKVFLDNSIGKYGVIDGQSDIIIPAVYTSLRHVNNQYFEEELDWDHNVSYYLNVSEKKFEKLPDHAYFYDALNKDLAVFYNEDRYRGVLRDNKTQIIPYQYDQIDINGNVLIAKGSKRGRDFYEFYTLEGKKIDLPKIKYVERMKSNPNTIVYAFDKKYGLIDQNGILIIPIQYVRLGFLNSDLLKYATNEGYDVSWGIVNVQGKVIVQPQFSDIFEFYKGYALVHTERKYALIDSNGKIVVNFPSGSWVYFMDGEDEHIESYYETDDGMKYTYKGELINK